MSYLQDSGQRSKNQACAVLIISRLLGNPICLDRAYGDDLRHNATKQIDIRNSIVISETPACSPAKL